MIQIEMVDMKTWDEMELMRIKGDSIKELLLIGMTDGFLAKNSGGKFNAEKRHIRAREIGEKLYHLGGFDLMVDVCRTIYGTIGVERATGLRFVWEGIGNEWDPHWVANLM